MTMKPNSPMMFPLFANIILTSLIGGTMMLFYYLVCDRALLTKETKAPAPVY
jgi:hypothetical protein